MKTLVKAGVLVLVALTLIGCRHDGVLPIKTSKICLDGVVYHQVTGTHARFAVAVAYNTDGTIQTCE